MTKIKDAQCASFIFVVLKSQVSENFNEIIEEIEKWREILG
jgi:hypothetical protein